MEIYVYFFNCFLSIVTFRFSSFSCFFSPFLQRNYVCRLLAHAQLCVSLGLCSPFSQQHFCRRPCSGLQALKLPRQLKSSLEEWGRVVPQTMLSSCDGVETKKHQTFCNKPEYKEEKRRTENHNPPIAQGEVTWDNEIERLPSQFAQNNTRDTVYRLTQNKLYTELSLQRLYQAKRPNRHRFSLVYERCLAVQLLWLRVSVLFLSLSCEIPV